MSAEAVLDRVDEQRAAAGDPHQPRGAARPVVRWVLLSFTFLVVLELTCRVEDWMHFRTPFFTPITSQGDLLVHDRDGIHGRPGARFQKWVMNDIGTRGPPATLAKAPGSVRVVVVGASETFGLSESPGREFPRQLEDTLGQWLARRCSGARVERIEVLNAALPGMSLPTIEQDVRNRISRFGADVILLYPTPAQYLIEEPPRAATPDSASMKGLSAARALYPRILGRFRSEAKTIIPEFAMTWLRQRQTNAMIHGRPAGWRFTQPPSDRLAQYDADLRSFIGTVRSLSATPVLATHANAFMREGGARDLPLLAAWEKFYPRATGRTIVAFDAAARDVTLRAAADSGVAIVDLAPTLASATVDPFSDFVHFTDAGAAIVAASLAPAVLQASGVARACGGD